MRQSSQFVKANSTNEPQNKPALHSDEDRLTMFSVSRGKQLNRQLLNCRFVLAVVNTKVSSQMLSILTYANSTSALCFWFFTKKQQTSVALVRERTLPTKRPPLLGEVSANFYG
jgi:hypothetical protein